MLTIEKRTKLSLTCGEDSKHNRVWLVKEGVYVDLLLERCREVQEGPFVKWDVIGDEGVSVTMLEESDTGMKVVFPGGEEVLVELVQLNGLASGKFAFHAGSTVAIWRHKIAVRDNLIPAHILNS